MVWYFLFNYENLKMYIYHTLLAEGETIFGSLQPYQISVQYGIIWLI